MKWEKASIKDICLGIYDGPHATPPLSDTGGIFLGIPNFLNGRLDLNNVRYISEKDLPKWTKRVTPKENDIVFSYEATLNLYAIIPEGFYGCLGRRMGLLRVDNSKVFYKFLYYYFFSERWQRVIKENTVLGSTVDRLPLIKFPDFPVFLPSLQTQYKIASILSAYDDLIENNQKQIKLLEEAAQRLYKEWFVDLRFPGYENVKIVDGVPEGWKIKKIEELADTMSGGTPTRSHEEYYSSGEILWLKTKELNDGFIFDTEEKITEAGLKNSSAKLFEKGCIILAMYGATIGRLGISSVTMCCNQACCVLKIKEIFLFEYVYLWLVNNREMLISRGRGSAQSNLSQELIKQIEVRIPSDGVLIKFSNVVDKLLKNKEILEKQISSLREARDRLLPKLMSGEIEV